MKFEIPVEHVRTPGYVKILDANFQPLFSFEQIFTDQGRISLYYNRDDDDDCLIPADINN